MSTDLKDAYRLDEQIGYLLRLATQRHTALFQAQMPDGLTATQFAALARLYEQGPCAQNQLGRRAAMDVATIKGVVDRLREKGLVKTTPSPNDKRLTIVALTDIGKHRIRALTDVGHQITQDTLAPLSGADQKVLLRLLAKLT